MGTWFDRIRHDKINTTGVHLKTQRNHIFDTILVWFGVFGILIMSVGFLEHFPEGSTVEIMGLLTPPEKNYLLPLFLELLIDLPPAMRIISSTLS